MPARTAYLCLQVTEQGQASHAHVHEIIAGLRRRGWDVDLFEPGHRAGGASLPVRLAAVLLLQLRLWARLRRYDVLYVRFHPLAAPSAVVARLLGVPVVAEVNGTPRDFVDVHPSLRRWEGALGRLGDVVLRRSAAIVVVTDELARWAGTRNHDVPIAVIPNAANPQLFRPRPAGDDDGRAYVCLVGALTPWQGVDVLLDAVADPAWPAGVDARIVGDGPARQQVERAAAADRRIRYEGVVAYERVGELVSGALAAVSLKTEAAWHASPLKLFEAMACGVPVIVTDQPGQARVVEEAGCGVVVPTGDASAVARAVRELHAEPERRRQLGEAGRLAVEESHSWDDRAGRTAALLAEVATSRDVG